jgi:LCP family protein required for cell wall assembly
MRHGLDMSAERRIAWPMTAEQPEGAEPPQQPAPKRPRRLLKVLLGVLVLVLVAAGGVFVYAYHASKAATDHVHRSGNILPSSSATPSSVEGPLNLVLMGSDSRDKKKIGKGRSDTLMLLHLAADRHSATIISFPRDMYVSIPGHGKNKINAAYSEGGPQLAIRTVQQLLGIKVSHAALVSFSGFVKLTNQLGGVTVNNKYAFDSHGYHYPKGRITISGKKALWFVRERHSLPNGDLDRAGNQRKVVQAILAKGLSGDTIRNPAKFTAFLSGIADNITVDNGFTDADLRKLALSLRMNPSDIGEVQAPVSGFADIPGIGSVDVVDKPQLRRLATAVQQDTLPEYIRKYPDNAG